MTETKPKLILDACCAGRMFWYNKNHPNAVYIDKREKDKGHCEGKPNHEVKPDYIMDFRKMDFQDNSFKLVIFDPPHVFAPEDDTCVMTKCYGRLNPETWKEDIKKGFNECWRVTEDYGMVLFKWNECRVKIKELLEVLPKEPILRDMRRGLSKSHWMVFMKIPTPCSPNKNNSPRKSSVYAECPSKELLVEDTDSLYSENKSEDKS